MPHRLTYKEMSLLPEHAFVKLLLVDDGRREIETHYITGDLVLLLLPHGG